MHPISTYEEYLALKEDAETRLLFKHSPTCPISLAAHQQVEEFRKDHETKIVLLDVLHTGDTKHLIADDLGITHESPQLIIFSKGTVQDHASHLSVTARRLRQHIDGGMTQERQLSIH